MSQKALTILKKVRRVLGDESKWCNNGWSAVDETGQFVGPGNPAARKWCVAGGVYRASLAVRGATSRDIDLAIGALYDAIPTRKSVSLADYNDTHTHAHAMRWVDRAIRRLEDAKQR